MGSSFNPQILVDKLAKLNSSQASIETLSHWCIFHMNKAKLVVETWDRQFHCSPREQRLAFLYLANDILQNSRRKGSEFVGEFWKVLPHALHDMIENGDEFGRNAALRLISIWEDRKVFGSRGQILKEELVGKTLDNGNRNGKHLVSKLKQPVGSTLDKIISGYQILYGSQMDEDIIMSKCRNAINYIEKVDKEIGTNINSGQLVGTAVAEELKGQHAILRGSIEQLTTLESSRASLVSYLREALQEQDTKLEQLQNQLQVAQSQSDHVGSICKQLLHSNNVQLVADQSSKEASASITPQSFIQGDTEQPPATYARQTSFPEKTGVIEEDQRKAAAAEMAAKLTASKSSAEMLSYVLSSLASEGATANSIKESSGDYPSEKRPKLENDQPYIPSQSPQQHPPPPFKHSESFTHGVTTAEQLTPNDPPPPPSSPPPQPPLPPPYSMPEYLQAPVPITGVPFSYGMSQQQPSSLPGYPAGATPMTGMAPFTMPQTNAYQSYQGSESLYAQPSSMPTVPMSRP